MQLQNGDKEMRDPVLANSYVVLVSDGADTADPNRLRIRTSTVCTIK
jgi:hypothetical protein